MSAAARQEDVQALSSAARSRAPSRGAPTRPRGRTSPAPRARTCATPSARRAARSRAGPALTAYNRGQVLYRLAEMMEARARRRSPRVCSGRKEVDARDRPRRLVRGLGGQARRRCSAASNPVAGPYFNFTVPEPTGVVARPRARRAAARRARLPARARARRRERRRRRSRPRRTRSRRSSSPRRSRRPTCPAASSTCSPGFATSSRRCSPAHMDVNAIDLTGADGDAPSSSALAAENVKRVVRGAADAQSPWEIAASSS